MNRIVRSVGILSVGAFLLIPTAMSVSAATPEPMTQKSRELAKAVSPNASTDPSGPSEYADRISALNDATNVRKRDRKIKYREPAVNATPLDSRHFATKASSGKKRAVWYGTDCYESTYYQSADYCWDDDLDAGASYDAEIIWADTYVSWNDQATVYTDIVPYSQISSDNWLRGSDNFLSVLYDSDDDGLPDIAIVPDSVSLKKNKSAGAYLLYYVESQEDWYYQAGYAGDGANCYAGVRRMSKANHWALSSKASWWQISADWTCLFDYNAGSISWMVNLEDYWGSDLAPDDEMANIDYVSEMNYPLVTEISPRRGYDRAGGEIATIYGENLSSITDIMERYEFVNFDTVDDTELEFETYGGIGCTDIDIFNADWYVWDQKAICYQ